MTSPDTLTINLVNFTSSTTPIYAFVTGTSLDAPTTNSLFLLQSDGQTPYFPAQPPSIGSPLQANCAIPLGAPGSTTPITIPHLAGARLWFSIGTPLTFLLNPGGNGAALVEPSVTNPSDPNINISWSFAEFTFSAGGGIFANISYVDFVCLPISLTLTTGAGGTQHVSGMPENGLTTVCQGLQAQSAADGNPGWAGLVVNDAQGGFLRALSPNNGLVVSGRTAFQGYFEPYVAQVWQKYSNASTLTVDTQAQWGSVTASVDAASGLLTFPDGITYAQPSTRDIFSCSSGSLAPSSNVEQGAITARLAAAFNRSTLLSSSAIPATPSPGVYYQTSPTNHYSRIVHAANVDGRGYAFPFDDVTPSGGQDQSGAVMDGSPVLLTVAVGGVGAYA